jgi:hypothetical protein
VDDMKKYFALAVAVAAILLAQGDASLQSVLRDVVGLAQGSYGSATQSVVLSVNKQGRVTAISQVPIQFPPAPPATGFNPLPHSIVAKDLTIGLGCGTVATIGCNVRFNTNTVSYLGPAVFRLVLGTGAVRIYAAATGSIVAAVSGGAVVACFSGPCVIAPAPAEAIPFYEFTSTAGNWDPAYRDLRAALSTSVVQPGLGMYATSAPGSLTLGIDRAALKGPKTCVNVSA